MNSSNAAQYLPLVQALADGKTIQFDPSESGDWGDVTNITMFNDDPKLYRIKPEPIVMYGLKNAKGEPWHGVSFKTYREAEIYCPGGEFNIVFKMVEEI